jgi:hypothetical protein
LPACEKIKFIGQNSQISTDFMINYVCLIAAETFDMLD